MDTAYYDGSVLGPKQSGRTNIETQIARSMEVDWPFSRMVLSAIAFCTTFIDAALWLVAVGWSTTPSLLRAVRT